MAPASTADAIEVVIDGNCGAAEAAPRKRNALGAEDQALLEQAKAGNWDAWERVVVAFSGGKDSLACVLRLLALGCPREKIVLWHHEIDGREELEAFMDWPCTPDYCRAVAEHLGLPIRFSWKVNGFRGEMMRNAQPTAPTRFETEAGTVGQAGGQGKPGTRMKWPAITASLTTRWCSAYLKIDVAAVAFCNDATYKTGRFMLVTGERREESSARAKYPEAELHRSCNKKRTVVQWRTVIDWTEAEVWDAIRAAGIEPHPCYRAGFGRASCAFCIFGNPSQLATARDLLPEQYERLTQVEAKLGFTMQHDEGLDAYTARGASFAAEAPADVREACRRREYTGRVATDNWQLPAGAFKNHGGPM